MTEILPEQLFVYEHDARRFELLVRIGYWIVIGLVSWVYGILALVCGILQWFFILIMGRRQRGLSEFIQGYLEYTVSRMPYLSLMTDKRPALLPDPTRISMQKEGK